ncbi:MAG: undecaprenyl-diphosphate phosphatase [Micromonosporaceae bacterium]|nr:undecaprenyl-diphosphate phosphatase [Micromonosporaceae bacterium]
MAVLSLVFGFLFCPLGIIFGHTAKKQLKQTRQRGEAVATAGLVVGYLELSLVLLAAFAVMGSAGGGLPLWKAYLLGIVEGVTEWLPVSSTGHLTIAEKLLGMRTDDTAVTGFTAVIQVGAIFAAVIYFLKDIVRIVRGFVLGLFKADQRGFDYRFGWYVILGSVPIAVVGLAAQGLVKGPLRSLWVVAFALILWSAVIVYAERRGRKTRGEDQVNWRDALVIGLAQCIALVPGVSRSGATISAGLLRDLDRVTATRLAFFLGIPALAAAGGYELKDALHGNTVGVPALFLGTLVSFVVGYVAIAWLIRLVARHSIVTFVWYRVALGIVLIAALATGALAAT